MVIGLSVAVVVFAQKVIADLANEAFAEAVGERIDELLAWDADLGTPRILVLHSGSKEDEATFGFRSRAAPLDVQPAPRALLRPLYRTLPRTFLVEDGRVVGTWIGFPLLSHVRAR